MQNKNIPCKFQFYAILCSLPSNLNKCKIFNQNEDWPSWAFVTSKVLSRSVELEAGNDQFYVRMRSKLIQREVLML